MKYIAYTVINGVPKVVMLPIGPFERKKLCLRPGEENEVYSGDRPLWPLIAQRRKFPREYCSDDEVPKIRFWPIEDEELIKVRASTLDQQEMLYDTLEWYGFEFQPDNGYVHTKTGIHRRSGLTLREQGIPGLWDAEAYGIGYVLTAKQRYLQWREGRRQRRKGLFRRVCTYSEGRAVLCNGRYHLLGEFIDGKFCTATHYPCEPREHDLQVIGELWGDTPVDGKTQALMQRLPARPEGKNPGPMHAMGAYFAPEYFGFYGAKAFTRERMILAARIIALRGTTLR